MIIKDNKLLKSIAYFDLDGAKRLIKTIHKAMADGTLRLIWQSGYFLIVTPKTLWATPHEQYLTVESNVNWTITAP